MENLPQNQRYEEEQLDEEQLELLQRLLQQPLPPPTPGFFQVILQGWEQEQERELEEVERRENDGISLEDLIENDGMSLDDFAKDLDVFDEDGPPLNSDTLPSDQALAVTVDTNSIVGKEIPLLQFSSTAQQNNSDEDFGNEEGEIRAERTEEAGIPEVQFDSRGSAKRKRKEKTPVGETINKKTTEKHLKGVKPTEFNRGARLRQRELKVDNVPSSKKQSKSAKGGTSQNTSRGGLADSNVDANTVRDQASSKKWSTSFSGKGGIKIENSCLTELTSENEGEVLDRAFRSSLRGIMALIKELNLRTCHKEVLKKTPFWAMFEAIIENKLSPMQCHQRGMMIIEIIKTYDHVTRKFRIGRESMELRPADMVNIFGISCGNERVSLIYCYQEDVKFVARREISESWLSSESLKQLLKKYVGSDEKDDVEDVARLLCVYLCHTFLFATGPRVKWVYLKLIEDLDRLRDYDWNEAIINELMSSIRKHHREPWKVTGCVMVLLYWLCEHTNLSKADHPEHPLGIVKWNIPFVVSRLKEIRLKDLKPGQVVSRQANVAGTVDDEVPVEKDIVQDSVSSGDVPVSNRGNDACLGNGKRDEKTPGGERVGRSTLKRVCQDYIPNESPAVADQEQNPQLNFATMLLASNQESVSLDTNSVTVKAIYEGDTFKFQLSKKPWGMAELKEQVKKRVDLEVQIKYKDEDGDLISIVCDDDLQQYILSSRLRGSTSLVVLLEKKGRR